MKLKHTRNRWSDNDCGNSVEKKKFCIKQRDSYAREDEGCEQKRVIFDTKDFKCRQCGLFVCAGREYSGVNNRNHCPRCLWSKHVDQYTPGDRKAVCCSRMEPLGLTVKEVNKKFAGECTGELMLIHRCTGCGKISINRIAADDDTRSIHRLYLFSLEMEPAIRLRLVGEGIRVLTARDSAVVQAQLFGRCEEISEMAIRGVREPVVLLEVL